MEPWLSGKESACNVGDLGSIPGLGRSPGERNGNPLQYACLYNPKDKGAWQATVHEVAKSRTRLSDWTELNWTDPSQYSCLGNPMDKGAWQATVHEVARSWTWVSSWEHPHAILNSFCLILWSSICVKIVTTLIFNCVVCIYESFFILTMIREELVSDGLCKLIQGCVLTYRLL